MSFKKYDIGDIEKVGQTPIFGGINIIKGHQDRMMIEGLANLVAQQAANNLNGVASHFHHLAADRNLAGVGHSIRERAMSSQSGFMQNPSFKQVERDKSIQQLLQSRYQDIKKTTPY